MKSYKIKCELISLNNYSNQIWIIIGDASGLFFKNEIIETYNIF